VEFYYHDMDDGLLVLKADGGLNSQTADEFVAKLERLIEAGLRRIIVDCSALDYISSLGIGVLVRLHKRLAAEGGDVKLAGIKSKVIQILSLVHLDSVLDIYPDVNRARLEFRPADAP
jgi:anti-sigma B factor antagonist